MKLLVTKEHLAAALELPWSVSTCLIQQALGDIGENLYKPNKSAKFDLGKTGNQLMHEFDDIDYQDPEKPENPKRLSKISALDSKLPIEIEIERL